EWLLNFAWLIDGHHYGYLQPVTRSYESVEGESLDIFLYSVNPNRDRVYIGEINNARVLTMSEADRAFGHYKKVGWLNTMKRHVSDVGGSASTLNNGGLDCFNISFRPRDFISYSPLRLARRDDQVMSLNRYLLVEAEGRIVESQWRRRKGTTAPPDIRSITR